MVFFLPALDDNCTPKKTGERAIAKSLGKDKKGSKQCGSYGGGGRGGGKPPKQSWVASQPPTPGKLKKVSNPLLHDKNFT